MTHMKQLRNNKKKTPYKTNNWGHKTKTSQTKHAKRKTIKTVNLIKSNL